ncbi:MAG: DUF5714 domain-containing protein [Bacilli bacterium]|nr:DUF5714 domain-containing protein [Bacillales bacterium]MDY2574587.1 DUF5714 domain-containing protein [Bacilli bacterium]
MSYTLQEKYSLIKEAVKKESSKNPILIVKKIMHEDFINIHGPEHHFLDGASFLVAYKNAGGEIDIDESLEELSKRTINMPGAMCGYWGICGSTASLGASLAIIHKTTPLSSSEFYSDNMEYTSSVINKMSKIGGPRCCKRNAFLSIISAVEFVKNKYGVNMDISNEKCEFSVFNQQCIKERCPFHK